MINTALISFLINSINIRTLSSYLKARNCKVFCLFCPTSFNELNLRCLIELLKENKIGLVGISLVTDDYKSAVAVTQEIKKRTDIPVIWGGAHANVMPEECLRHADMICRGEGEEALLDLVRTISHQREPATNIKNIWFKTPDGIIQNDLRCIEEKLDHYPFPDFDLRTQYVMTETGFEGLSEVHLKGEYSIMTSRGCPYSCNYCYNNYRRQQFKGKGQYLRVRSIKNVIEELAYARTIFKNLQVVNFWDDSFISRQISDFEVFKRLYLEEIKLPFFALIEPMAFSPERIKLLKESGLKKLQVGIQSGSERVNREVYGRRVSNDETLKMAEYLDMLGIKVVYDLIFNNPYENQEDLIQTIDLLLKFPKPILIQGYNLIFYPGTEITKKSLMDGHISLKSFTAADDFSTIEGKNNSPISMRGCGQVSNRFYDVSFDTTGKEYFNEVISLFSYKHATPLIRILGKSETMINKTLLKLFVLIYGMAAKIKSALI